MDIVYIICLTILTLFLLLLFVDIIIGFGIFYSFFTKKGKYKRRMEKISFSSEEPISEMEKLFIFSFDGITLSAFYENDNNSKIVLLVHGYGQSKKNLIPYSKIFRSLGFDQLFLDLRCHGESEGDEISLGEKEAKDIDLWIDKVLDVLQKIGQGQYYVDMALAWTLSVCFVKYRDKTLNLFEKKCFSKFVQNKAIQKCRESFRVSEEDKQLLQKYKLQ